MNEYYTNVAVTTVKYQTADGRQFTDPKDAELHGKLLKGEARKCLECGGSGQSDAFGDGREFHKCTDCGGTGYQTIKSTWGPA